MFRILIVSAEIDWQIALNSVGSMVCADSLTIVSSHLNNTTDNILLMLIGLI